MQPPVKPPLEAERLTALRALGLLDTATDERFARYVRLARRLIDVPIAAVTLVDAERQWFKHREGLAVAETPRDVSFCGHAIVERGVFYIPDAQADSRFADNPLVTGEPHIRFYAGCPVYVPGNLAVGTLCVIDTRPRALDTDQLASLRDLADCLQREICLHMLLQDVGRVANGAAYVALQGP